jgi:LITAF-like zinc ribbon domain
MKSVINDLFPVDSRARRRRGLVSESLERIVTHILPLHRLGKRSEQVHCPYCKQITKTRVEQSDSKTTKGVNAILWMGMGDPFALTSHDWCQNIDHFCANCNGHLVHKPYRGQAQPIPEDPVLELPLGYHHERTELPASPNRVSELYSDQELALHGGPNMQVMLGSRPSQHEESRMLNPAEMDWEIYQPSLMSPDQVSMLTEAHETEPTDILAGHYQDSADLLEERPQRSPGLGRLYTINHNPRRTGQWTGPEHEIRESEPGC